MLNAELEEEITEFLACKIAEGFSLRENILRDAAEVFDGEAEAADLMVRIEAIYGRLDADHEAKKAAWPSVTDCDRLDAAFEELNAKGIMARHHWTCCATCGPAEMPAEFKRLKGQIDGKPIIGYAFYHWQDTERVAQGGPICLGYGSTQRASDEAAYQKQSLQIAQTVCDVLRAHGLAVTWNGSQARRIEVELDWKRRQPPARYSGHPHFVSQD